MPCLYSRPRSSPGRRRRKRRCSCSSTASRGWSCGPKGRSRTRRGVPWCRRTFYLRTAHDGGMRMNEDILATTTDAQGHYSFSGEVHPMTESPVLLAKVEGRPRPSSMPRLGPSRTTGRRRLTLRSPTPAGRRASPCSGTASRWRTRRSSSRPPGARRFSRDLTGRRFPTSGESGV